MDVISKRPASFIALALLSACLIGCKHRNFKVVMSLDHNGAVTREIEVSISKGDGTESDLSKDSMVARAAAIYGSYFVTDDNGRRYKKTFPNDLPKDIEHAGFTNHATVSIESSPLGRHIIYCERMPGRTQWSEVADASEKTVDLIIRALVAAFEQDTELKSRPEELKRLTAFLKGQFRNDVRDLLIEIWIAISQAYSVSSGTTALKEQFGQNVTFRMGSLLVERGYSTSIRDASIQDNCFVNRAILLRFQQEMSPAAIMWPPNVFREILKDQKAGEELIGRGLTAIGSSWDEFRAVAAPLIPTAAGDSTTGTVAWQTKTPPDFTNGIWDAAKAEVRWDAQGMDGPIPANVLWAAWSEPDEKFQRRHFGRILIKSDLGRYNKWYNGLDALHKKEWDRFLLTLPGENSVPRLLSAFEFTDVKPVRNKIAPPILRPNDPYAGTEILKQSLKDLPPLPYPDATQPADD